LNEILKQVRNTGIRRRKMEHKSSERTKPKTKKIRFSLNNPKIERVFLAGDSNGCMLVVPEIFGMNEHIRPYQGRLTGYQL
jgi:dienelactone hydrolase